MEKNDIQSKSAQAKLGVMPHKQRAWLKWEVKYRDFRLCTGEVRRKRPGNQYKATAKANIADCLITV